MQYYKLGIAAGILALNFVINSGISYVIIKKKSTSPISIQSRITSILGCLRSLAAGLLCGLCFLDLLPSIHEYFGEYFETFPNLNIPLPAIVNGSFMLAFVLMWSLDTAMHWVSHWFDNRRVAVSPESQRVIGRDEQRDQKTKYAGIVLGDGSPNNDEMQTSFENSGQVVTESIKSSLPASELTDSQTVKTAMLRTILLLTALSVHAFFEGLAIGLAEEVHATLTLTLVIACHEPLALFSSLSGYVASPGAKLKVAIIISACYSIVVPCGVILGTVIVDVTLDQLLLGIFMSLASGAVFFVVFIEMLPVLCQSGDLKAGLVILSFLFGFLVLMVLTYATGHHHDHDHKHHANETDIFV